MAGVYHRSGATSVKLKVAGKDALARALRAAWRNTACTRLAAQTKKGFEP
jgi:hypothetical protein